MQFLESGSIYIAFMRGFATNLKGDCKQQTHSPKADMKHRQRRYNTTHGKKVVGIIKRKYSLIKTYYMK